MSSYINLDCLTKEELRDWITQNQIKLDYAWKKLHAINAREIGLINEALKYEEDCDQLYEKLNDNYKW